MKKLTKQEKRELRRNAIANYIISNQATIRDTAKYLGLSKSTVFKDVSDLKTFNYKTYMKVNNIIQHNKSVRHIRGGISTKVKHIEIDKAIIKKWDDFPKE